MIDRELREVVGAETRQPRLREWSPRRGGRGDDLQILHPSFLWDIRSIPLDAGYLAIAHEYWRGIYANCYLHGVAIAVSQLAGRGTPRFIPILGLYIFQVLVDREPDIAWCAIGGPPPSSPIEDYSGFCPRPDRRCSA
eukprot:1299488-Pleurochrysis_carterae.AAC.1